MASLWILRCPQFASLRYGSGHIIARLSTAPLRASSSSTLTTTQKLRWPDGAEVTATVTAETPQDSPPVTWSGATERVPATELVARVDGALLRVIFQNLAEECGIEWSEELTGEYISWAE